jgi:FHS family L-fucose permease-like MFS transporter
VMSIIGGAIFPAIMGRISDATNIQTAFIVPLVCYVYILYFALRGYKPADASRGMAIAAAVEAQRS